MTCRCGAVTADGIWLCSSCVEVFEYRLAEVDTVLTELRPLVPRLTLTATYGQRTGGGAALHAPAPVNVGAVSAIDALHRWLMSTALKLAETTGERLTGRSPDLLASYLISNMPRIVALSWAPDLHKVLDGLLRDCESAARMLTQKEYAGACQTNGCGTQLFTEQGSNRARCDTCGAEYEAIQEWRNGAKAYARAQDDNTIGYPQALSQRLNRVHGIDIGADYIRVLADRGLLTRANPERGADGKKLRAMYRLGDIKNILKGSKEVA